MSRVEYSSPPLRVIALFACLACLRDALPSWPQSPLTNAILPHPPQMQLLFKTFTSMFPLTLATLGVSVKQAI